MGLNSYKKIKNHGMFNMRCKEPINIDDHIRLQFKLSGFIR